MKQTKRILALATALSIASSAAVFAPAAMAEGTVDLSQDSAKPALAENLMLTSVADSDNLTAARNFNIKSKRINTEVDFNLDTSDTSHWNDSQTYSSSVLEANQEINNPAGEGHGYYGATGAYVKFNQGAFSPNKTYVFKAYVKSEGTEDAYYTTGIESTYYETMGYSNEYGKTGMKVETGDYQEYASTMTLPAAFDPAGNNWFISILPDGVKAGAKIRFRTEHADDVYLAEEQAYELNVTASQKNVAAGDSFTVSAEVLNQIGLKGRLSQNITWHAMNVERTAEAEGFIVDGNTITVADSVEPATYALVAESATGLVKGVQFTVKAGGYKDSAKPALAENLMLTSVADSDKLTAARNFNIKSNRINTEVDFNPDTSDTSHWEDSQIYSSSVLEAKQEINNPAGEGHGYYGATGAYVKLNQGAFSPNETYVFKAYVKSDGTEDAYYTTGIESTYYETMGYSNEYGKTGMKVEAGDYQEYASTMTLPAAFDPAGNNWFISILPDGVKAGAKIRFRTEHADDVYLAEEQAYEIAVTADDTNVTVGGSTKVSAKVLNQVGIVGTLDQKVEYVAATADRTELAKGITVLTDGTVNVARDVAPGEYAIVAMSEKYGLAKGVTIKVNAAAPTTHDSDVFGFTTENEEETTYTTVTVTASNGTASDTKSKPLGTNITLSKNVAVYMAITDVPEGISITKIVLE